MIGTIAAILTTLSFLPQAYQVIKTKDTSGISLGMYTMFVIGVVLWVIHGWNIQDFNLIGANAITFIFASIDYSRVIAPVVADLCTTPVALSAPPNSFQNNSQS